MSLVITIYTREGITMAADSRLTLSSQQQGLGGPVVQLAVGQSDSANKLFLAPGDVGIATYGAADIQGVPITGYVESFIRERLSGAVMAVDAVPNEVLKYFRALPGPPAAFFHVAGYKTENGTRVQHVWVVDVAGNFATRVNQPTVQGAQWGGEVDVLGRLIQPVFMQDTNGNYQAVPTYTIPWQFFTLQDAIDFCAYAIRATIESMRFQNRPKTVGGKIDVLVLRPTEHQWVARKSLHPPDGTSGMGAGQ